MTWEMLRTLPEQFRWAADLTLPDLPSAEGVLVAGMGGSGASGDYARPVAAEHGVRLASHKTYGLPGWASAARPLVVAVSYSGNTEETVSAYQDSRESGLDVVVVAGGGELARLAASDGLPFVAIPTGLQPRAALGYLLGAVIRVVAASTALPDVRAGLEESAVVSEEVMSSGEQGPPLARDLAEGLAGRIVVVYGSDGLTEPVARRWKTQINENAKTAAFASLLPEADHNEITGWSTLSELTRNAVGVVMLRDAHEHARVALRFRLTSEAMAPDVGVVGEVHARGESRLARMAALTVVGDADSIHLAEMAGVDPVSVKAIDRLKEALREGE